MNKKTILFMGIAALGLASCSDDDNVTPSPTPQWTADSLMTFSSAEWNPGGDKGTTTNEQGCYSNESPAIDDQGLYNSFKFGEQFFERDANLFTRPFWGLGPAWVRAGCEYCHPSYGHGKWQSQYRANDMGNGYLLVVYHPTAGTTSDGRSYTANSYVTEVTGMPQTQAMSPFKAPIDENNIFVDWKTVTSMPSGLAMTFPNSKRGESFRLYYPDVTIGSSKGVNDGVGFNTDPKPENYEVRLESTIGMYGTGLIDAISQDSMKVQYQREAAAGAQLNPGMWDGNDWASSAWYSLDDGTKRIKKFTYAMTRATLLDGPGANAIWNITNVSRSDRHMLYTDPAHAWAKKMSEDSTVIKAIQDNVNSDGTLQNPLLTPYISAGTSHDSIAKMINHCLSLGSNGGVAPYKSEFEKYFVNMAPWNGTEEMADEDFYNFAVWHRGLAVPRARNLDTEEVQRGKKLFYSMGCTSCHRPSWYIDTDDCWTDKVTRDYMAANGRGMVKYDKTLIWPYTDLVQHRLHMANDIRTGWCRTTPLWGRGLSVQETGAGDRLHDCRAHIFQSGDDTTVQAIMWHAYSKESDAYWAAVKFYNLSDEDRDAVVAFINAI